MNRNKRPAVFGRACGPHIALIFVMVAATTEEVILLRHYRPSLIYFARPYLLFAVVVIADMGRRL